jgi:hypothetical protein
VTSRADAARVVEMIELLLDANQWTTAHNLYRARCDGGHAWKNLPAARLGQRAATAFIATPDHQHACAAHLTPRDLGFYLNAAGLLACLPVTWPPLNHTCGPPPTTTAPPASTATSRSRRSRGSRSGCSLRCRCWCPEDQPNLLLLEHPGRCHH